MANEKKRLRDLGVGCLDICAPEAAEPAIRPFKYADITTHRQLSFSDGYRIRLLRLNTDRKFLQQCYVFGWEGCANKGHGLKEATNRYYEVLIASSSVQCFVLTEFGRPVSQANISNALKTAAALDYYALEGDFVLDIIWTKETEEPQRAQKIFLIWITRLFSLIKEIKRLIIDTHLLNMVRETAEQAGFRWEKSYWRSTKDNVLYSCTQSEFTIHMQQPEGIFFTPKPISVCNSPKKYAAEGTLKRT
jgi:hypothetical protein